MHDEHDEDLEFWSRVDGHRPARAARPPRPTRTPAARSPQPRRTPPASARPSRAPHHTGSQPAVRTRVHHDDTGPITRPPSLTGAIPVIGQRVREAGSQVDPMMRRIGALAVVVALAVPVALALRSGGEADATAPADLPRYSAAATTAALASSVAPVEPAAGTQAAPAAQADARSPWADVDVDALPPAVPKHPEASAAPETSAVAATTTTKAAPAAKPATAAATTKTVVNVNACSKKYSVRAGDAWTLIASRVGVTTKALLQVNNATTATMLYPGRSICLPAGAKVVTTATKPSGSTSNTTTKPAASKPPTTVAPAPRPANTYSRAQVEAIIRSVWPDQLEDEALRIATRESNLNPTVRNYCCYGLFQIYYSVHKTWLASIGVDSASDLYDPKVNAYAAYMLYLRSGSFRPWQ